MTSTASFYQTAPAKNLSIPFLPGNTINDVTKQDFRRAHTLGFKNGYTIKKDPQIGIGGDVLPSKTLNLAKEQELERTAAELGDIARLTYGKLSKTDELPKFVPAYVAYDKLVLRFEAYFKQTVHESKEQFHLRRVRILYFVEDDSIAVVEPPQENSGIPQGVLIKRQKLPKNSAEFYTIKDLNVATNVTFYGKTFRIVSCDRFTERYMTRSLGLKLNAPEGMPADPYLSTRNQTYRIPRRVQRDDKLYKFLLHDRHVLRFYCVWDDRDSMFGELREFVLHYYLVDDCIEVREVHKPNEGRDPFPVLLRRQPLPKHFFELSDLTEKEKYSWQDLRIGNYINVLNRAMLIYDCDDYTRSYYRENTGLSDKDLEALPVSLDNIDNVTYPAPTLPPYNNWGDEEDSRGNCKNLVPKVPKKDFIKMLENEHKILRFAAVLVNPSKEDQDRKFVVSYRLADDTMLVYEPHQRNSGIIGGKFLERTRLLVPGSTLQNPQYYKANMLRVGTTVHVFGRDFLLVDADDFVFDYMEAQPQEFPSSNIQEIVRKVRSKVSKEVAREIKSWNGVSRAAAAQRIKEIAGDALNEHEIITLARAGEVESQGYVKGSAIADKFT